VCVVSTNHLTYSIDLYPINSVCNCLSDLDFVISFAYQSLRCFSPLIFCFGYLQSSKLTVYLLVSECYSYTAYNTDLCFDAVVWTMDSQQLLLESA